MSEECQLECECCNGPLYPLAQRQTQKQKKFCSNTCATMYRNGYNKCKSCDERFKKFNQLVCRKCHSETDGRNG